MAEATHIIARQNSELLRNPATSKMIRSDHVTEIDRGDWPDLFADIIHKNLGQWMLEPEFKKFSDMTDAIIHREVPLEDFQNNDALVMGGFAQLVVVPESDPFPAIAGGVIENSRYNADVRGGLVFVTRQMIKGDQVGAIKDIPKMLAWSAIFTRYVFVWQTRFRANPVMTYDAVALFNAAHNNVPVAPAALTPAGLLAAINRMAAQTLPGASADYAIGLTPKILWAGPTQRQQVFELLASDKKNNATEDSTLPNFFKDFGIDTPIILDGIIPLTGANSEDWGIIANPFIHPTMEIGYVDGQRDPEIIVQDTPNVGEVFTNDRITWKIRHEYGATAIRHEVFDANLVP